MTKQNKIPLMTGLILAFIIVFIGLIGGCVAVRIRNSRMVVDGGVVKNWRLKGYNEEIKSNKIVSFSYEGSGFKVSCELKNNNLHILSTGNYINEKDDSDFSIEYNTEDLSFLDKLQEIVKEYNISLNNGYEYEVAGLPPGYGDKISVIYDSGEKIWKYSNQTNTIKTEAIDAIYNAFYDLAKANGHDFISNSSVTLNDDENESLDGTWKGTHFGSEYKVVFNDKNIKIYKDGELTDDTEYTIIDGKIVKNQLKEGKTEAKSRYDYEEFSEISVLSKRNSFTIVMYFMKDSYSIGNLIKE